jgi:hypothetical protein
MKITKDIIKEKLRQKPDGSLYHREQKDLEFKESFNLRGLAEYFRDFAAFANNVGGYIIFGVTDSPRRLKGLSKKSLSQFNKIDEERISGFINEHFAPYIDWEMDTIEHKGKTFGVLYAYPSSTKPVICKKGDDKQVLKNGVIFYRYAGRTEVIQYSELATMIANRVQENNELWIKKVKKIGEVGPSNVGILDTESGIIEGDSGTLLIDNELVKDLNFIKEGHFEEKEGAKTLRLVGSAQPIDTVEIDRIVKKRLTDEYPLSYRKLEKIIRSKYPKIKPKQIHEVVKEYDLKNNPTYSAYNFRNKDQEEEYKKSGHVPKGSISLYNERAIAFIVKIIKSQK